MKVSEAIGTGENILQKINTLKPNIVLLDLGLRSQNSLQVVKSIKKKFSGIKIIVIDGIEVLNAIVPVRGKRGHRCH